MTEWIRGRTQAEVQAEYDRIKEFLKKDEYDWADSFKWDREIYATLAVSRPDSQMLPGWSYGVKLIGGVKTAWARPPESKLRRNLRYRLPFLLKPPQWVEIYGGALQDEIFKMFIIEPAYIGIKLFDIEER